MSPARTTRRAGVTSPALLGLIGLVGFAALFEVLPRIGVLPGAYFPTTGAIAVAVVGLFGRASFWTSFGQTVGTWALGLAIAVAGGLGLGVLLGAVPLLRAVTASTVEFLRPIPSVALIPLVIVLYGTHMTSTVILVVYAAFWPVLIQVLIGVSDVDPIARETALSYRLGRLARVRYLSWPTALPYALTGIRLAASVALVLTITGELIVGSPGLGHDIATANSSNAIPQMYALVVVTGLIGATANLLTRLTERRLLVWHPSVRQEVPA